MSNARKLHPFRAASVKTTGRPGAAYPGETCVFHPGCCEPDDFTCPGCGEPAAGAVTYHVNGTERRQPFCAAHEAGMGAVAGEMALRTTSQAN